MLIAIGDIYTQVQRRADARELMQATQARMREQPGCDYYAFAEALDDPGHFLVLQQWSDRAALDRHWESDAFRSYQDQIGPHLIRSSELRVHDVRGSARPVDPSALQVSEKD
jgi:quinol monooxygenase YgiN